MKGKAQGVIAHHAGAIAQIKGIPKIGATPEQQKLLDDFEGKAEAFSGELLDGIISSLQNLDISEAQNLAKEFKALINNKDPEHNAVKQPDRFIVGIYILRAVSPELIALSLAPNLAQTEKDAYQQLARDLTLAVNKWLEGKQLPEHLADKFTQIQSLLVP
jgi:hypothetical protein